MAPKSTALTTAQERHDTDCYPDEGFFEDEGAAIETQATEVCGIGLGLDRSPEVRACFQKILRAAGSAR